MEYFEKYYVHCIWDYAYFKVNEEKNKKEVEM